MELVLTEDQELIAKTAADFVKQKSPIARVRELRDTNDAVGFSRALWKEMAELGWVGHPVPRGVRRRRPRLRGAGRGDGGARPHARAGALPLDRAARPARRCALPATRRRRRPGCRASCKGEAILALAQQEAAQPLRPAPRSRRAPSAPAPASASAARRSRCSTATSPTPSSWWRARPAARATRRASRCSWCRRAPPVSR